MDLVPCGDLLDLLVPEGWREGKRVHKRTLANLSDWPPAKIETLRRLLKNQPLVSAEDAFDIVRSKPHGPIAAVLAPRTIRASA